MPTIITGTTGIDKIAPGSVQQDDLAANVVGVAPCFHAYRSATQSLPNAAMTLIQLDAVEFDLGASFDIANRRHRPTVAGYYQFNWMVHFEVTANGGSRRADLYKNGSPIAGGTAINAGGSQWGNVGGSRLVYMNGTTDYVDLRGYQSTGGNLLIYNGVDATSLSGFLVRAA